MCVIFITEGNIGKVSLRVLKLCTGCNMTAIYLGKSHNLSLYNETSLTVGKIFRVPQCVIYCSAILRLHSADHFVNGRDSLTYLLTDFSSHTFMAACLSLFCWFLTSPFHCHLPFPHVVRVVFVQNWYAVPV